MRNVLPLAALAMASTLIAPDGHVVDAPRVGRRTSLPRPERDRRDELRKQRKAARRRNR